MSWSRRALVPALLALSACGLAPVYAPGGPADGLRGRIDAAAPEDQEGFFYVRRIEERLGPPSPAADLRLEADLYVEEDAVGFLPDGSISRYDVLGRVDWRLLRGGEVVAQGREGGFTGYSATSTTVATTVASRDARRRLMVMLADRTVAAIYAAAPLP